MNDIAASPVTRSPPSVAALFLGFLGLGLIGFGGVLPLARRMLVEQRRWLTPTQFTEMLGLCQFLPGGNVINLSVAVGLECQGLIGAVACLVGLIAAPTAIVVALGVVYGRYNQDPVLRHVFAALAAAAAGLLVGTALKMTWPLRTKVVALVLVAITFLAIAIVRLPLLPTMLVLGPLCVLALWRFPA